jgi:hypothetical protein
LDFTWPDCQNKEVYYQILFAMVKKGSRRCPFEAVGSEAIKARGQFSISEMI